MKADLHMHSTYSDGKFEAKELFRMAKENKVDLISITDHDTVLGVEDNIKYSDEFGVKYIPGIELSTVEEGKPVHVLGYFTDDSYKRKELLDYCRVIKKRREDRVHQFIINLKELYSLDITYEEVLAQSSGIIARPHIAKAISNKYPQYNHDDIFEQFIGDNNEAYVPSCDLPVQEGIDLLRNHNCLVVLAHPVLLKEKIKDKVMEYNFDGYEAKYFRNQEGDEEYYRSLAKSKRMFITGGGDFHGIKNDTKHGNIGDVFIDGDDFDAFLNIINNKKQLL